MNIKVGLIFGGASHEHEVSLKSAKTFLQKIDYKKFSVVPFMITSEGQWIKYATITKPIRSLGDLWIDANISPSPLFPWNTDIDIFFPLIHGETGEDGKLQGFFEMTNVKYVGCGVEASAVGMNKLLAKEIAKNFAKVDIVPYQVIRKEQFLNNNLLLNYEFDYPCFIKPARAGSSVGVSKIYSENELSSALESAFKIDELVLVEKAIKGIELEVGVIGNEVVETSIVGEIEYISDFYDYDNKYNTNGSVMHIPARISSELSDKTREWANRIYQSIGCKGYARVDFFLEQETNQLYFNEINTSPGMTNKSMFPVLFKDKYSFTQLLTKIINEN